MQRKLLSRVCFAATVLCRNIVAHDGRQVPTQPVMVQMEPEVRANPSSWTVLGPAAKTDMLELTFAVKQRGLRELHQTLMRVSDPESREYGMHLTNQQVQELTAPEPAHIAAVRSFLSEAGIEAVAATPNSDFINARVTVEQAENLLSAKYVRLSHVRSGVEVSRTPSGYQLPKEIAAVVDFVAPTVQMPSVSQLSTPDVADSGLKDAHSNFNLSLYNSPKNLRKLYNVGKNEGKATANKQAVTAFLGQKYSSFSLKAFWGLFCRGIKCGKGQPKLVGDATSGFAGTEAMLDIETVTGLAGNVESEFWGFGGRSPDNPQNEPFMKWLTQLSSTSDEDVPRVFSTSYGENENSWSIAAASRLNVEFQKAGTRGISLLFASGDSGANCQEDEKFLPQGPASSPYVTAVGGTSPGKGWPSPGSPGNEVAAGLSSGGFSNYWPMPEYQKSAVENYLQQPGLPGKQFGYNTSGRAFPDISAQAMDFFVYATVPQPLVAGTSCASPTAAAIFALLNDLRMEAGKSSLGFLNPLIYKSAAAFNDITLGSSTGGRCGHGWPSKAGWDAATGLGTPDYARLAQVIAGLPKGNPTAMPPSNGELVV